MQRDTGGERSSLGHSPHPSIPTLCTGSGEGGAALKGRKAGLSQVGRDACDFSKGLLGQCVIGETEAGEVG